MIDVKFSPNLDIRSAALGFVLTATCTLPASAECVNDIYYICPSEKTVQTIPVGARTVLIDTVVKELKNELKWKYNWCLKAQGDNTDEFYVHWDEIGLDSRTSCGGFIGVSLTSSRPPANPKKTTVYIGSDRKKIHPNITMPKDPIDSFLPKEISGTYVTELVLPALERKAGEANSSTKLTVISSYERISPEEVSYQISYISDNEESQDILSFRLSDDAASRSKVIGQELPVNTKHDNVLKFVSADAPENLLTYLTVYDVEGIEVGSAPVSLAVPSERGS